MSGSRPHTGAIFARRRALPGSLLKTATQQLGQVQHRSYELARHTLAGLAQRRTARCLDLSLQLEL